MWQGIQLVLYNAWFSSTVFYSSNTLLFKSKSRGSTYIYLYVHTHNIYIEVKWTQVVLSCKPLFGCCYYSGKEGWPVFDTETDTDLPFWCFTDLIFLFSTSYRFLTVDFSVEEEVSQNCFASVRSCTAPGHPQWSALSHSPFKTQTEMWTCVISQNIQEEKQISKRKPYAHMGGFCCPRISLYIWKIQLCYWEVHVHWTPVKPILQISRCPHARNRDAKARIKITS